MAPAMCSNYFDSYNLMSPPLSPSYSIKTEMDFKTEIEFKTELDFKSELDFKTDMATELDFKTEIDFKTEMEDFSILPHTYDDAANFPDISDFDLSQITENLDMDLMEKMMMEAVNSPLIENLDDHEPKAGLHVGLQQPQRQKPSQEEKQLHPSRHDRSQANYVRPRILFLVSNVHVPLLSFLLFVLCLPPRYELPRKPVLHPRNPRGD